MFIGSLNIADARKITPHQAPRHPEREFSGDIGIFGASPARATLFKKFIFCMARKIALAVNIHSLQEEEDSYLKDLQKLEPMQRIGIITELRQSFYQLKPRRGQISKVVHIIQR